MTKAARDLMIIGFLFLLICFSGCEDAKEHPISTITITNIPVNFLIHGSSVSVDTYKVYVNGSNTQSARLGPAAAKGHAYVDSSTLVNGSHTVTIQLHEGNDINGVDPNADTPVWSGTTQNFTIYITAKNTGTNAHNAIWAKGGLTFDESKAQIDWNIGGMSLIDFRNPPGAAAGMADFEQSSKDIYRLIVAVDPYIHPTITTVWDQTKNPLTDDWLTGWNESPAPCDPSCPFCP